LRQFHYLSAYAEKDNPSVRMARKAFYHKGHKGHREKRYQNE
jgi:hypothetical protein